MTNDEMEFVKLLNLDASGNPIDQLDVIESALYCASSESYSMHMPTLIQAIKEYKALKAKDLDSRRCMYCGGSVQDTNEAMLEHVFSCEKRPEKKLLAKAFETESALFSKIMHLTTHDYKPLYCDECKEIKEAIDAFYMLEETDGS